MTLTLGIAETIIISLFITLLTIVIILGLRALLAKIMGGGLQRNDTKSNVGTGDNTNKLMVLYRLSTAAEFARLKIVLMII